MKLNIKLTLSDLFFLFINIMLKVDAIFSENIFEKIRGFTPKKGF